MELLLASPRISVSTCVHMVMLTRGADGFGPARLAARCAGRSSAAVGPSRSDSAKTAPQVTSAVSAAATARLRTRRGLCVLGAGAAPQVARAASLATASLAQCGPGSCAAAASLYVASGLPTNRGS